MKLSLTPTVVPVEIESKEATTSYELREMTAEARDAYLSFVSSRMTIGAEGKPSSVKNFDGMQAALVSRCLYQGDTLVPAKVIQSWPGTLVGTLFAEAQKINGLVVGKEEEVDAKKG